MKYDGKSIYVLPQSFVEEINLLENLLVVPKMDVRHTKSFIDSRNIVKTNPIQRKWIKEKTIIPEFKSTIFDVKIGLEKDINDIRKSLNMISKKNFNSQKSIIMNFLREFVEDTEALTKISVFIFDIASSNMFYGDVYADLYVDFSEESSIFKELLHNHLFVFKKTIDNINPVDSNYDYDGYCKYIKENDKRRSLASFYMLLTNRNLIDANYVIDVILYFQRHLNDLIDLDAKNVECEEISELLFILITVGKTNKLLINNALWITIIDNISKLSRSKVSEHKSLSSRVIFKQLDLIDFMMT
jgi:hypothetical protein